MGINQLQMALLVTDFSLLRLSPSKKSFSDAKQPIFHPVKEMPSNVMLTYDRVKSNLSCRQIEHSLPLQADPNLSSWELGGKNGAMNDRCHFLPFIVIWLSEFHNNPFYMPLLKNWDFARKTFLEKKCSYDKFLSDMQTSWVFSPMARRLIDAYPSTMLPNFADRMRMSWCF